MTERTKYNLPVAIVIISAGFFLALGLLELIKLAAALIVWLI